MSSIRVPGAFAIAGLPSFGEINDEIIARPGLTAWFQVDPEYGAAIAAAKVASITDLKRSGVTLVQAIAERRPAFAEAQVGGEAAMLFDGATTRIPLSINQNFKVAHSLAFIVKRSTASAGVIYGSNSTGSTAEYLWFNTANQVEFKQSNRNVLLPAPAIGKYDLVVAAADGAGGIKLSVAALLGEASGGDNGASNDSPLVVGSLNNTGSSFFNGGISDMWVYNTDILGSDDTDLQLLRDYAFYNYGIG